MDSLGNDILIILALSVILIIILYFFIRNLNFNTEQNEDSIEPENQAQESSKSEIFHLYNHESEKSWALWIQNQKEDTKLEAFKKLTKHLEDKPEKWGFITMEVLESLKHFKSYSPEDYLSPFINRLGNVWREYKSIPNYYQKALEVLVEVSPRESLKAFQTEFDKKSNSDISIEKKKIIISLMPNLNLGLEKLIVEIFASANEIITLKSMTLHACSKLDENMRKSIFLEALDRLYLKYINLNKELKKDDANFLQDLIEDSLIFIHEFEFFTAINNFYKIIPLQEHVTEAILKIFNKENKQFTLLELYALSRLEDNKQKDIKRALAKRNDLDLDEINNIIMQEFIEPFEEDDLMNSNFKSSFPMPNIYTDRYKEFKNLFFKSIDDDKSRTCEKNYGGLLICGNEPLEKLYFARSLATEKEWSFLYVDITKLENEKSYQEFYESLMLLKKPYLLYMKNPQTLYQQQNNAQYNFVRDKLIQLLTIQAMDSKVFYAGEIQEKYSKIDNDKVLKEAIKNLCSKFFPKITEMNTNNHDLKNQIVSNFLKSVKSTRFEKRSELFEELIEQGQGKDPLNFIFFVIHMFSILLLVFGRDVSIKSIESLIGQFKEEDTIEALELQ